MVLLPVLCDLLSTCNMCCPFQGMVQELLNTDEYRNETNLDKDAVAKVR